MASIVWSPRSLDEIEAISRTIQAPSSRPAALLIQRIFASVDRLTMFPYSGRVVPEFGREEIREVIVGSYRVIHLVENDVVFVLTIQHAARRLRGPLDS